MAVSVSGLIAEPSVQIAFSGGRGQRPYTYPYSVRRDGATILNGTAMSSPITVDVVTGSTYVVTVRYINADGGQGDVGSVQFTVGTPTPPEPETPDSEGYTTPVDFEQGDPVDLTFMNAVWRGNRKFFGDKVNVAPQGAIVEGTAQGRKFHLLGVGDMIYRGPDGIGVLKAPSLLDGVKYELELTGGYPVWTDAAVPPAPVWDVELDLPASAYSSFANIIGWGLTSGSLPEIPGSLMANGNVAYFNTLQLRTSTSTTPVQLLSLYSSQTASTPATPFTDDVESNGVFQVEASDGTTLDLVGTGADTSEPYQWNPSNASEVYTFASHVRTLTDKSATLRIRAP